MRPDLLQRRSFLKAAVKAIAASPILALTQPLAAAQPPAPSASATPPPASKPTLTLNPRDFGATGDGATKDTVALQLTIERCSVLGGGEVVVPAGNYLTGALALRSNVTLRLAQDAVLNGSPDMADYPLAQVRWEGRWIKGYLGFISATDAVNVGLLGPGKIIGSPTVKGRVERPSNYRLPALLEFINCTNVRVADLFTQNAQMWSIHPTLCENVSFTNCIVHSGADGIDVDSCRHVVIDGCTFDTADDCISLKSGRGEEAASQIGINPRITTEDVRITNCTFVDRSFACIGIGSEISGGIRNVTIDRCRFIQAHSHAIYIKSRPGRGAFIEDITASNLEVSGVGSGFLRINNLNSGKHDEFDVPGDPGIPAYRNFRFSNIRVTDVPQLVQATEMHPAKPLDGFTLSNVTGTCARAITMANMIGVDLAGIKVTGYTGPLLSIANVTGTGLEAAVAIDPPQLPDAVPTPAEPYHLH
jgi:polygalacturonase